MAAFGIARLEQNFAELGGVFWREKIQAVFKMSASALENIIFMFFDMFLLLIFDSSNYQLEDFYISRILKDQDSWRAAEAESPVPSVVQSGRQSNTSSFGNTTSKTITVRRLSHAVAKCCRVCMQQDRGMTHVTHCGFEAVFQMI